MIAVVGAGVTGLALGLELDRLGADFTVFEADDRPGGVIRSATIEGRTVDWGPQRTRMTRGVAALVDRLQLRGAVVTAPDDLDLFVYRAGRLRRVPFSVVEFLTSDVVGLGAKLRVLLEPLTAGADPAESVADYFTRKVGRGVYETLVAPLYGGLYASDPADMRVGSSLSRVLDEMGVERSLILPLLRRGGRVRPPPACSFKDGMAMLPRAMASELGERLRLETPVRRLSPTTSGWRVELDGETVDAEAVVLTVPAGVAADLLGSVAPSVATAFGALRYNPLAVVHLDAQTHLRGLGFQVAFTEPDRILRGVTFNDSLFGRRDLYTAYLGGGRHPEVVAISDERLAELAVDEFRACTRCDGARVLSVGRERMPAWDVTWTGLEDIVLPRGVHIAANWWSRPGLPGRLAEAAGLADRLVRARDSGNRHE